MHHRWVTLIRWSVGLTMTLSAWGATMEEQPLSVETSSSRLLAEAPIAGQQNRRSKLPAPGQLSNVILSRSETPFLYGLLEFRPSYTSSAGEFHTENTAEVGVKLKPKTKVSYVQAYNTNLLSNLSNQTGLGWATQDGWFSLNAKEFWQSENKNLSTSYELRLITPTDPNKARAGYFLGLRNEIKVAYRFNDFVTSEVKYRPILFGYSRVNGLVAGGRPVANPIGEQHFILNHHITFSPRLTLDIPIYYIVTAYNQYPGASNSGAWKKNVLFWPELDYEINAMHTVGISYYTDNCISAYGSGLNIAQGFSKGVVQLVWDVTL